MSRFHVAGRSSRAVVAVTALVCALSASVVLAQLTNPSTRRGATTSPTPNTANIGTQALLPDLVATRSGPGAIYESYTADNPCTAHNHTHVLSLQLGGRFQSTYPAATVVLARGSQQLETWTIATAGRTPPVNLGSFSWTRDHPCPGSGNASAGPPEANTHRLVVDPSGAVQEVSKQNNVLEFYVPPDAVWAKAP